MYTLTPSSSSSYDWIFYVALVVLLLLAGVGTRYRRRHANVTMAGDPVLLGYYVQGDLMNLPNSQTAQGFRYSTYAAAGTEALIVRIELPFATDVHLLGIPKDKLVTQLYPASGNSLLERVVLEGDYQNYFTLYAEKGQQQQARYVLNPKTMAYTVDFCRSHNWEIINNELYFLQASADNPNDPTDMFADIASFVEAIKPALGRPVTDQELKNITPYNEERRTSLNCPICHKPMPQADGYFICHEHGILLNAAKLADLRKGTLAPPKIDLAFAQEQHGKLTCPSCGSVMTPVNYSGGKTVIDTCSSCEYRWLDANEAMSVAQVQA